jgi:predicted transcriptional regulator
MAMMVFIGVLSDVKTSHRSPALSSKKSVRSDTVNVAQAPETLGVALIQFIAARLRELRAKHSLTQEQVAVLLGTDLKWYQRVEWCKKDVRATTIERLATIFGISVVEFLDKDLPSGTKVKLRAAGAPHKPRKTKTRRVASKAK